MSTNLFTQVPLRAFGIPENGLPGELRPWGRWMLLHEAPGLKLKLIEVSPGHRLSLQYHQYRSENWVCVSGCANAQVGKDNFRMQLYSTLHIPIATVHRLGNSGDVPALIVEIQEGERLLEDDIVRLEDDYNRADHTGF